ncbi:MAG: hypothetical protein R3197_00290 [Paracoccaceae bacterium]|nr:hypothetical protein [Paracoccaceae bacterium]
MQFENKITLGNALTIGALIFGLGAGWKALEAQQGAMDKRITSVQEQVVTNRALSDARNSSSDGRLRALEVSQASTSADLRNILNVLNRIERQLESR